MIEVMVAMLLMGIAGSVLVLGTGSSAQTTEDALNECIAMGMAQQLLDEVVGTRYSPYSSTGADTAHAATLGPSVAQVCNGTRQLFNDSGAFNGYQSTPPVDQWGVALGTDNGSGGQRPQNFWRPYNGSPLGSSRSACITSAPRTGRWQPPALPTIARSRYVSCGLIPSWGLNPWPHFAG